MNLEFFRKKQRDNFFLCLDIGTEAVKAIIAKKEQLKGKDNKKIVVLGSSLEYFKRCGVFDNTEFQKDILKETILKAIKSVAIQTDIKQKFALFNPYSKNPKLNRKYKSLNETILLSMPANFLKARIIYHFFKRENVEKKVSEIESKAIHRQVLRDVKEKAFQEFAQKFGILPQDVQIISLKFLEKKIDGYLVPKLQNYKGKILEFKILVTFSPISYLQSIKEIIGDLRIEASSNLNRNKKEIQETFNKDLSRFIFEKVKIVYPYQNLQILGKTEDNVVFIDIGGEVTQIFLTKKGNLRKISEFGMGGRSFSQSLRDSFGIEEDRARELKERYSKKSLNPESQERIREILENEKNAWTKNLRSEISKMNMEKIFSADIFIFGGASQLPEIQESLNKMVNRAKKIEPISLKDFQNIEDRAGNLKISQSVPCLLISNFIP